MPIKLYSTEISEPFSQENFRRIQETINKDEFFQGQWRFISLTFGGSITNFKYPHHLSFTPRDIIQTSLIGAGSLTFNYSSFDATNLDISTTGACVVRFFIGRAD